MIQLGLIRNYFPAIIRGNAVFDKQIVKEYLQLLILDFLSTTKYIRKMTFIGGTNLRLIKGIDRFSEDLDFDCKELSKEEFTLMTDEVFLFLERNGIKVEARDKENPKLSAFRRSIYFPDLLFDLNLSGHKDESFLIKIEAQDQGIDYQTIMANVKGCGFYFQIPVPPDGVMCAMKLSALISRSKGRDFYDAMFLLAQTQPDYNFLSKRTGISNLNELKLAISTVLESVDLKKKARDFEHLLFSKINSTKIFRFSEFIDEL